MAGWCDPGWEVIDKVTMECAPCGMGRYRTSYLVHGTQCRTCPPDKPFTFDLTAKTVNKCCTYGQVEGNWPIDSLPKMAS